jgi:hypothetical protein
MLMTFPDHLDDFENHKHKFRENMQTNYRKTTLYLYKIANLAVLIIRNTYYMIVRYKFSN